MTIQITGKVMSAVMPSEQDTIEIEVVLADHHTLFFNIPVDQAKNWMVGNTVHLTAYSYTPPPDHATSV